MTFGIVLAAGRSTRMGSAKPLLEAHGTSFLRRAVTVLREGGCDAVVVVVPPDPSMREEAEAAGAAVVVNDATNSEQVDSLRMALDALPADALAAVVLPVDHPLVESSTVRALLDAFVATRSAVVLPVRAGEPGHPALIARALFDAVRPAELPEGLRTVLAAYADRTTYVNVEDPGVAIDLDTPADLERHLGAEARRNPFHRDSE